MDDTSLYWTHTLRETRIKLVNDPGLFTDFITFLHTEKLEETSRFYETILGFELVLDQGRCKIFRVSQGGYIGFCSHSAVEISHQSIILTFVTQEVDQLYSRLVSNNVPVEKPPQINQEFGIYHCFFRDPNGYLLEVQRFLDPEWSNTENR